MTDTQPKKRSKVQPGREKRIAFSGDTEAVVRELSREIAHELRQPLTALQNFMSTLMDLMEQGQYEKIRTRLPEYRDRLTRNVTRISGTLDDLKRFSQKNTKGLKRVCAATLLETLKQSGAQMMAGPHPVHLEWRIGVLPDFIMGEEGPLLRLFLQLLAQASEAAQSHSEPVVCVQTRIAAGFLEVSVCDNGAASPASRIHPAFVIAQEQPQTLSASEQKKGMNLGLTLGLGRSHPGTILVQAAEQGGTCMRVRLPIAGGGKVKPDVRAH
ncbi:MAG: HAMP domain-containing histidine kinase [Deltaproteobacteria bacterium]|nr:HAMP domain-containing histidine kinase [Deltaproteobacteria bacterium]